MTADSQAISAWDRFWFRPASPLGLIGVRFIVAANALWIILSRPDLPTIVGWPSEFWIRVDRLLATRYFLFGAPVFVERSLYLLLHLALISAMIGVTPRVACLVSGILLYHFAPFENIIWHVMGPYFSGLTLPTLALLILGFAATPKLRGQWSPEFRWPLALIQILLSFNYFFAAISKLHTAGLQWVSAENIRGMAATSLTWETPPPLASSVFSSPAACWSIAIITMVAEVAFILVPFSRTAAAILVPLVFFAHIGIVLVLGIVFLGLPCLLIYLPWDSIDRRIQTRRSLNVA
ncbi:MAG TPA: hypothetical protein VER58_00840 [Thermoanaerobaculia bacterium]|nr:hypothetical protein [Thermoanaerobaculia bacterium]